MIHSIGALKPAIADDVFVAWNAEVAGDVTLGAGSSVWFGAVIRADVDKVVVGKNTNVQDGAVIHEDRGVPCVIGDDVTIGHRAVLHGCAVGNRCLIGMGAIVLDGARIGEGSVIGAGALVTQGKDIPPRSLVVGSPGKVVRQVSDEDYARLKESADHYVEKAASAMRDYREVRM